MVGMSVARHLPVIPLLACVLSTAPAGQGTTPAVRPPLTGSENLTSGWLDTAHLAVRLSTSSSTVAPGAVVTLFAEVSPKPRMHVYAPGQKDYIPISLTLERDATFRAAPPRFPKPEKYFFAPLKETQLVYSAAFRIAQDVTIASTPAIAERARSGQSHTIKGMLRYQACDDAICYMPKNVPVSWSVKLKP
jgi:DsbC/DsbD-like thiol-disulfide interchange protein